MMKAHQIPFLLIRCSRIARSDEPYTVIPTLGKPSLTDDVFRRISKLEGVDADSVEYFAPSNSLLTFPILVTPFSLGSIIRTIQSQLICVYRCCKMPKSAILPPTELQRFPSQGTADIRNPFVCTRLEHVELSLIVRSLLAPFHGQFLFNKVACCMIFSFCCAAKRQL